MKINVEHFKQTLSPFFQGDHRLFDQSLVIVERGQISISFMKGSGLNGFTCSGVYITNPKILSKIKFQWLPQGPGKDFDLHYQCNCVLGKKELPCEHSVALFYEFILQESRSLGQSLWDKKFFSAQAHVPSFTHGVRPLEYGTHIAAATALLNTRVTDRFHQLSYQLLDGTTKIYQPATPWPEHLPLYLHVRFEHQQIFPTFSFSSEAGEKSTISLFADQSVFDWSNGNHFEQPEALKTFVKDILNHPKEFQIDDVINAWPSLEVSKCEQGLSVCGKYEPKEIKIRSSITKSHYDNYLEFDFFFSQKEAGEVPVDVQVKAEQTEDILMSPPWIWQFFVTEGPILERFHSRLELQEFLKKIYLLIQNVINEDANHVPLESNKKNEIIQSLPLNTYDRSGQLKRIISLVLGQEKILSYDLKTDTLYQWETKKVLKLWASLVKHLNLNNVFRSSIDLNKSTLKFVITRKQLFSVLSYIFHDFQLLEIPIYYQDRLVRKWNPNIQVTRKTSEINWFEFQVSITPEDLILLKKMKSESGVIFSDKGLVVLDSEKQSIFQLIKEQNFTELENPDVSDSALIEVKIAKSRIFEIFALYKMGHLDILTPAEMELCHKLLNLKSLPEFPVADKWKAIARDYQIEGQRWIRFLFESQLGACLADDMGLGKTLQTIMFLESCDLKGKLVLIVCPVSLLHNWMMEFKKFSSLSPFLFYGNERAQSFPSEGIVLSSYGILRRDYASLFSQKVWDIFVMDEVQNLKNSKSLGAAVARKIQSKFRLCLTGTPVENDISEFTNILDLAVPGVWGPNLGAEISQQGSEGRSFARQMARPFLLRRTKEQVLKELPPKTEQNIFLSFSEEEELKYRQKLISIQEELNSQEKGKNNILTQLLELRLLCLWQHTNQFQSTKIKYLMEQLEQILEENHSCLIFSQFTTYLDHIGKAFAKRNWNFCRLDGSMLPGKRQNEVNRFQNGECPLFLISLKAGGTGLNLTKASYVFIMDPWWNPVVEQQAIDRTHRIGQENPVTIYRPIIKNSVEERVLELQKSKRELFNDLLGQGDGSDDVFSGRLTYEDFRYLLS
ncbi:MAG: DEAD/DEAH box helicase [Bacteriovoracaceae bacterium]|nr:DEAD/DEAH box helicase [Bacteriovoracaceae bacterium]